MTDFTFSSTADFNATTVTLIANTPAALTFFAERFGVGCISVQIRKSEGLELAEAFASQGLSYQ